MIFIPKIENIHRISPYAAMGSPAARAPLSDIVDRDINALARNAKGLRGIQRD